jgi:hypothetical protein
MKYLRRSQYKYAKSRYRIRNWPEYEAGLRRRGDLTVWLADAALDAWRAPASGRPGGPHTYSDLAIEAALTIRMIFHLPLRQTEGFLRSLTALLEVELPTPDHTTLSRRLKKLGDINFRSKRAMVENTVFRYKAILGQRMRSRSLGSQRAEVRLACKILNTMTSLGRPDSVKVG